MNREALVRRLIITQNMTVDGAVEMLDDWFEPQAQADQSDLTEENRRQDRAADALLLGRQTFEDFRGYWRDIGDDDATGVGEYLNSVAKYVVSSSLDDPQWAGTTVLRGDPVEEIRALKQAAGRDIVLTGSLALADTVISVGLVDEYRFFVYPTAQARGRRLFPEGSATRLSLVEARAFDSGIVLLRYAPAAVTGRAGGPWPTPRAENRP